MNDNATKTTIYIRICSILVVGSSPVISNDFPHFLFLFVICLTCKQTCKVEFTRLMIESCLIKTLPPNNHKFPITRCIS